MWLLKTDILSLKLTKMIYKIMEFVVYYNFITHCLSLSGKPA
jgi:hypothetical protein